MGGGGCVGFLVVFGGLGFVEIFLGTNHVAPDANARGTMSLLGGGGTYTDSGQQA